MRLLLPVPASSIRGRQREESSPRPIAIAAWLGAKGGNPSGRRPTLRKRSSSNPVELGNMSDDLRKRYNIKDALRGVVITGIHASSPAADKPWRPGNIIVEIADEAVSSVEEFRGKVDRMRKDGQNSALLVVAGADGEQWFVSLSLMP